VRTEIAEFEAGLVAGVDEATRMCHYYLGEAIMIGDRTMAVMTIETIEGRIKELEAEITTLKVELKRLRAGTSPKTFADLYGILGSEKDFTEEEIDAALYRIDKVEKVLLDNPE
jgi:uncharacterized small protein (DUF1192 family)